MTMQGSAINNAEAVYAAEQQGVAHAEEHHDFRLFGLILFLAAESMIFLGLFSAYLAFRLMAPDWPPEGTPELEVLLPGVNTLILISSSFVIHRADTSIKKNDVGGMRFWFGLTALMGAIFLGGQVYEYSNLEFGLTANQFASTFYALTGFHGLHVFVGILLMLAVLWLSRHADHYSSENHFGIEAAELYWHFVDVVWIVLFLMLYIL